MFLFLLLFACAHNCARGVLYARILCQSETLVMAHGFNLLSSDWKYFELSNHWPFLQNINQSRKGFHLWVNPNPTQRCLVLSPTLNSPNLSKPNPNCELSDKDLQFLWWECWPNLLRFLNELFLHQCSGHQHPCVLTWDLWLCNVDIFYTHNVEHF